MIPSHEVNPVTKPPIARSAGVVGNVYGLHNEEYGAPLTVCERPKLSLDALWPQLKAFR